MFTKYWHRFRDKPTNTQTIKPSKINLGPAECALALWIRRPPPWGFKACRTTFVSRPNSRQNPVPSSWTPPLIPPRHPRAFRRASENFAFWTNLAALLLFWVDFCTPQKSSKKRLPKNMPQNLKSRTPDRPNVDFGIILDAILSAGLMHFSIFFRINFRHRFFNDFSWFLHHFWMIFLMIVQCFFASLFRYILSCFLEDYISDFPLFPISFFFGGMRSTPLKQWF